MVAFRDDTNEVYGTYFLILMVCATVVVIYSVPLVCQDSKTLVCITKKYRPAVKNAFEDWDTSTGKNRGHAKERHQRAAHLLGLGGRIGSAN